MSLSSKTFTVRLSEPSGVISREARRIILNADLLKATKICAGDVLALSFTDSTQTYAVGIAWPSYDVPQDTILTSASLLLTARLADGAKAALHPLSAPKLPRGLPSLRRCKEAGAVRLRESARPTGASTSGSKDKGKRRDWLALLVREALVDLKYLAPTQTLEVTYEGQLRRFQVSSVSASQVPDDEGALAEGLDALSLSQSPSLWTVGWDTIVTLDEETQRHGSDVPQSALAASLSQDANATAEDAYSAVGGLDQQIQQIRDLIEIPLTRPELFRQFGLKPPRGILLHGPPGTGKTHLARAIAASTGSAVLTINGPELSSAYHGETESRLRDVFAAARARSPCIVVLDEVDALCPRREDGPGGEVEKRVVAQLLTLLDGIDSEPSAERVVVVATTNRPNALDPALRRPGRFDREIEVGVPDAPARAAILRVLLAKAPHHVSEEELRTLAAGAHGYVGADLGAVVREAGTLAIKRYLAAPQDAPEPQLTIADLLAALPTVRPSALRSLFQDVVPVRYADIGGQAGTIQKLRECVEWPLLHPEAFERLGVRAPKGVLLYGPPGCSKTLLVRACATESGVNFLAVKGPELLSKFVGDSERAVREIFHKARALAPSLIFFDEIDALASSRSGSDTSGGAHEGVLTSLLNEMDGVQELVGVTIVAATNRPEIIDSALMRPGRLDRILYVGPPDLEGRVEILRIRTRKMSVDSALDLDEIAKMTDGYSGAEMAALCQEAALTTMKRDINAPFVPHEAFVAAAKAMKKQITADVVAKYEKWRDQNGVTEA